jgi:Arabinose-binding domain of AraC transcription regulator, N-term
MAKLPAAVLDGPNLTIGADSAVWLLEELARLSGQEIFGLLLAETRGLANVGMPALAMQVSSSARAP